MSSFWTKWVGDKGVAALAASSPYVIRRVLKEIPPHARRLVEFGAGDGVLTKELIPLVPREGSLLVVERNQSFADELRAKFQDTRVRIMSQDALAVAALEARNMPHGIDAVFSSIPLSFLNGEDRELFVKKIHSMLASHGVFVVFHQYSLLALPLLRKYFRTVEWHFEIRNVFPCFVMVARP